MSKQESKTGGVERKAESRSANSTHAPASDSRQERAGGGASKPSREKNRNSSALDELDSRSELENDESAEQLTTEKGKSSSHSRIERKNFWILVLFQTIQRTGWIFKTESIVMPAILDAAGAPAWMRGMLPSLNRLGQTIFPNLLYRFVLMFSKAKYVLNISSLIMSAAFLALGVWFLALDTNHLGMMFCYLFLGVYLLFFIALGMNELAHGILRGKLIQIERRGRLLGLSNAWGSAVAIVAVCIFLPMWLNESSPNFSAICLTAGGCFALSGFCSLLLSEAKIEKNAVEKEPVTRHVLWNFYRADVNLRKLIIVAACFGSSMMLFPHYGTLAKNRLGLGHENFLYWIVLQNAGTGVFSLIAGWIADRWGNRIVLLCTSFAMCASPLLALIISQREEWRSVYPLVFFLAGLTPITIKILGNYALELTQPENHGPYLLLLALGYGVPVILVAPLAGWMIDLWNFDATFLVITSFMTAGFWFSFSLIEPRHIDAAGKNKE